MIIVPFYLFVKCTTSPSDTPFPLDSEFLYGTPSRTVNPDIKATNACELTSTAIKLSTIPEAIKLAQNKQNKLENELNKNAPDPADNATEPFLIIKN